MIGLKDQDHSEEVNDYKKQLAELKVRHDCIVTEMKKEFA